MIDREDREFWRKEFQNKTPKAISLWQDNQGEYTDYEDYRDYVLEVLSDMEDY